MASSSQTSQESVGLDEGPCSQPSILEAFSTVKASNRKRKRQSRLQPMVDGHTAELITSLRERLRAQRSELGESAAERRVRAADLRRCIGRALVDNDLGGGGHGFSPPAAVQYGGRGFAFITTKECVALRGDAFMAFPGQQHDNDSRGYRIVSISAEHVTWCRFQAALFCGAEWGGDAITPPDDDPYCVYLDMQERRSTLEEFDGMVAPLIFVPNGLPASAGGGGRWWCDLAIDTRTQDVVSFFVDPLARSEKLLEIVDILARIPSRPDEPIPVSSAFTGAGGLDAGLGITHTSTFETVNSFDKSYSATTTFYCNQHNTRNSRAKIGRGYEAGTTNDDDESIHRDRLKEWTHLALRHRSVVALAGPPCQGFSSANPANAQHVGDSRNGLVLKYIEACIEARFPYIILEEVTELANNKSRLIMTTLRVLLLRAGYQFRMRKANSIHYGSCQLRLRLILIAAKQGLPLPKFPRPTHQAPQNDNALNRGRGGKAVVPFGKEPEQDKAWLLGESEGPDVEPSRTVRDILCERNLLPPACYSESGRSSGPPPESTMGDGMQPVASTLTVSASGRQTIDLSMDEQAPTIMTSKFYKLEGESQCLTVAQLAAIQHFPRDYTFVLHRAWLQKDLGDIGEEWRPSGSGKTGADRDRRRYRLIMHMVGNAVDGCLAKAIGESVLEAIRELQQQREQGSI